MGMKKYKYIAENEQLDTEEITSILKHKFCTTMGPAIKIESQLSACLPDTKYIENYIYLKNQYLLVLKDLKIDPTPFFEEIAQILCKCQKTTDIIIEQK